MADPVKIPQPGRSRVDEVSSVAPQETVPVAFAAHAGAVARFVRRMGVHARDVDDVVQDVFLAAHAAGGYRPGAASERSWYVRLAWYAVTRHRRRSARTPWPFATVEPVADAEQQRTLEQRELLGHVAAALDTLGDGHRAVLVLFEIEGYAAEEIAAALQIPVGTVHSRLYTARRRFAAAMSPRTRATAAAACTTEGTTS